jgi:hypothetical protein
MNSAAAGDFMSVHAKAVRVIQGNWIDAGSYTRYKTLYFDDSIYIFNGGKFNALLEQWDAEWIRMAYDVDIIDVNGEEDFEDYGNSQGDALVRLLKETHEIRESVNNVFDAIPFRVLRDGIGAPTTAPTSSTDYTVKLNYDPATENVAYKIEPYNPNSNVLIDGGSFTMKNSFIDAGGFVTE